MDKTQIVAPRGVFDQLTASNRVIWLKEAVDERNMAELSAELHRISLTTDEDIYLFINSPGGSVTAGLMFYDMINLIPNDVVTIGMGMCASMGQFLLTIGAPGKRFITPNARVLLHQPSGGFGGTTSDISIQASLIVNMKHQLAAITAERTGKTVEQVNIDGDRDRWFTASEALEYGFVDHVITNFSEINTILSKDAV
jgi:ATP-dependent Clp protease protease subunit